MAWRTLTVRALAVLVLVCACLPAQADQGGVSFWLPGQYGSFAALAPSAGWSLPLTYYNYSGSAGHDVAFSRGRLTVSGLQSRTGELFIAPTYTPDTTILGAVPSVSLSFAPGKNNTSAEAAVGPLSVSRSDTLFGISDLSPTAQLFWSSGVNNAMVYLTGNIPVGSYNPDRLANLGIGHGAIDGGGAYTYQNKKTGTEASATFGLTANFVNPSVGYTNGTDSHLDLGVSQLVTEKFFVGLVGYYYQQLLADRGQRPVLGPNELRTRGVGPQIGYNFDVNGQTITVLLKGYTEFEAYRRAEGRAIFFSVNFPVSGMIKPSSH